MPTLRNRISIGLAATVATALIATAPAFASAPTVASLDATARASGNRPDIATRIGDRVFSSPLPAQVSQISANEFDGHLVLGIRLWGVKFHKPLTQRQFVDQIAWLVRTAFAAAPSAQEVDIWTSVPISIGKGAVVSGDLARPTSRVVFTLSVPRTSSDAGAIARETSPNGSAFWDDDWARIAFRKAGA
jgi:hypothetical protein